MEFLIGSGKAEIPCFKKDIGMMGYGMSGNTVHDQLTSLHARSLWIEDNNSGRFVYVCAEICFITPAVHREVLRKIQSELDVDFKPEQLMLSAQHTHSAPGGYSEYALYNITIPGFHQEVFDSIVEGVFESVKKASESLCPGALDYVEHDVDPDLGVAWNRMLSAYNENPENRKLEAEEAHLAIDRRLRMLRILRNGKPNGQINWFGVHATCVGNENHSVTFDNKGYAAQYFEEADREIGIFAQGLAGDISPYYHGPGDIKKRKAISGRDEHEYAKRNGKIQFEESEKAFGKDEGVIVEGKIDTGLVYHDFSNIKVDEEYAHGDPNARTWSACHGVAFFNGTRIDGRGLSDVLNASAKFMSDSVKLGHSIAIPFKKDERKDDWREKYRIHGKKKILMDADEHRIFGTTNIKGLIIPGAADPTIAELKKQYVNSAMEEHQWVPHVLPLQIVVIGKLAFVGCPGEYTVTAGKRLEQTILEVLKEKGVEQVILSSYTNAYMGYVTTYEEYQLQTYEGGHTIYGQWTLGAFQTKFKALAKEMLKPEAERKLENSATPVEFSSSELSRRSY